MTARTETCSTCVFMRMRKVIAHSDLEATVCCIRAPVDGFPYVELDDWCGEHQPTTHDTPSALDELIASTADQYGDIEP
jgi:hypothetical protein